MHPAQKLSEAELDVLDHVLRYGMALPESLLGIPAVLKTLGKPADAKPRVQQLLKRLTVDRGYLAAAPLYGQRVYYYLTPSFVRDFGPFEHPTGPLSERQKIQNYGLLAFCCFDPDDVRQRLTREDFQHHWPQLYSPTQRMHYYLQPCGNISRLGYARIDTGGHGRWDRLIEYCQRDLFRHRAVPAFGRLIDGGEFELALITALLPKAQRLAAALAERPLLGCVHVRIHVVPELLDLIAPAPLSRESDLTQSPIWGFDSAPARESTEK